MFFKRRPLYNDREKEAINGRENDIIVDEYCRKAQDFKGLELWLQ